MLLNEVKSAMQRLKGVAHDTPILSSSWLNQNLGFEVFFKCENFQRVGAFKFRGAYNAMSLLSAKQKSQGVIAYSSGNHAQAVACVGKLLGIQIKIVMPNNAPEVKLAATREYGAEIILYDPETEVREEVAAKINPNNELTLIPPFNCNNVIAGQGTAAMEFLHVHPDLNYMLVPCGGGGLLSGTAVVTKQTNPNCQMLGIEPELADDATQSFYSGHIVNQPNPPTIADGTRTASVGDITFDLMQKHVDQMLTVSELSIIQAVQFFFYRMKIVVEPSGALGLAALMSNRCNINPSDRPKVGVIISGGNVDAATMSDILSCSA